MTTRQLSEDLDRFLSNLTSEPGIYRMLDEEGEVLYVGKASNLKKRVNSYFTKQNLGPKSHALIKQIKRIEVHVTRTETEALLLESSLIKSLRPKYNVLLRDDKSYPYIHVSNHPYPRIEIVRFKKKPSKGNYFGPYPSAAAVRETLGIIKKVFKIRTCRDSYFKGRSRPCLQYQIQRCSAPCTAYVPLDEYANSVCNAIQFLQGKSQQILKELTQKMEQAVNNLAFEEACVLRDQLKSLRLVQEKQGIIQLQGDADILAVHAHPGFACVQWVTVREGEVLASRTFFPSVPQQGLCAEDEQEVTLWQQVFQAFIGYFYLDYPERIPALLITDQPVTNQEEMETILRDLRKKAFNIQTKPRGNKARWMDFARNNLQLAIAEYTASATLLKQRYQALKDYLHLEQPIVRMECFDISHHQGEATIASCVVFDAHGPCKREYRRFNVTGISAGDDYAAMEQVLTRRFKRLMHQQDYPTLLIIDGGKGQVRIAREVLSDLQIEGVQLLGIAKGAARKAGWERLILSDESQEMTLPSDSPALHLLQHIRNEAHRFAIQSHRKKIQKLRVTSSLESLEGVGSKRRQALLQYFGGLRDLAKASVDEITKVQGISAALAYRIHQHFHPR